MKRLLILLLILTPASAFLNSQSLVISYSGYNNLTIEHIGASKIVNLSQEIYLYPQDDEIINQTLVNLGVVDNHFYYFKEGDFSSDRWSFNLTIRSNRSISFIRSNPPFPYPATSLPFDVRKYLSFDSTIDSSPELKQTADNIVKGAGDYLTAVQLLAEKTYEMLNYTFSEPYSSRTLSASSTLASGKGVCDEYAVLFISLAREEGIPARYVSGYAYGNIYGSGSFGSHAWAEVYVPDYGWVSVDPTYGEYGWIDASHIAMLKEWNISHNFISTTATVQGSGSINVENNIPPHLDTSFGSQTEGFKIISSTNESFPLSAKVNLNRHTLAEGDYFLLNVSVSNPTSYYIPLSYEITTTKSMKLINASQRRELLLSPHSVTTSYTIMQAPELGSHVIHPIDVYIPLAGTYSTQADVNPLLKKSTSLDELLLLTNRKKAINNNLVINASVISPVYDNSSTLFLTLLNLGNTPETISIDIFSDVTKPVSRTIYLGINENASLAIPLTIISKGESSVRIYLNYGNVTLIRRVPLVSAINPSLSLSYKGKHTFSENPSFVTEVSNPSMANIPLMNLTIITPRESMTKEFTPGSAPLYEINTTFPKTWLNYGNNSVRFVINYIDNYGTKFSSSMDVIINKEGSWIERIIDAINSFFAGIINLFK